MPAARGWERHFSSGILNALAGGMSAIPYQRICHNVRVIPPQRILPLRPGTRTPARFGSPQVTPSPLACGPVTTENCAFRRIIATRCALI